MNPINRKPAPKTENIFYGVDANNRQAVEEEYKRLKKQHRNVTILVIVVLIILGAIFFDFARVNMLGGKPIVAISKKVDNGTLFTGLGYKVLYCDDGNKYIGAELYKTCNEPDMKTFDHVVYEKIMEYGEKEKIIDKGTLTNFVINTIEFDENNPEGGSDYILDVSYTCSDSRNKCFRTPKEYNSTDNIKMYVRINKYNEVYSLLAFKDSGKYYDTIRNDYIEKVKAYFKDNELLVEDNLRSFSLSIIDTNGKYKFRGISYADSYLIKIVYNCNDNTNTCVKEFDNKDNEGDYANLSFFASMFLDENNNVMLVGPREYLDID